MTLFFINSIIRIINILIAFGVKYMEGISKKEEKVKWSSLKETHKRAMFGDLTAFLGQLSEEGLIVDATYFPPEEDSGEQGYTEFTFADPENYTAEQLGAADDRTKV